MQSDTEAAALAIAEDLEVLVERVERDTLEAFSGNQVDAALFHFDALRRTVAILRIRMGLLQKIVEDMSTELIPTLFTNAHIDKTINIAGLGRVTVGTFWSATMLNRRQGMSWLRSTGNEGLIIQTVNAKTLGAFAHLEAKAGKPLPSDIFSVTTQNRVSITGHKESENEI
jgi:hypothetical protein